MSFKKNTIVKNALLIVLLSVLSFFIPKIAWHNEPEKPLFILNYWLSEDKGKMATQSSGGILGLWDTKSAVCGNTFACSTTPFGFAQFSPDGNFFGCLEAQLNSHPVLKWFNFRSNRFSSITISDPSCVSHEYTFQEWRSIWIRDNLLVLIFLAKDKSLEHAAYFSQFFLFDLEREKMEQSVKDFFATGTDRFALSEDKTSILSQGAYIFKPEDRTYIYTFSPRVYSLPLFNISHMLNSEKMQKLFEKTPVVANAKWVPGKKIIILQIETQYSIRNGNSNFLFWNLETDELQKVETTTKNIKDFFFINQGNKILAFGEDKDILTIDIKMKETEVLVEHSAAIRGMIVCEEKETFATYDSHGDVVFWHMPTLKQKNKVCINERFLGIEKAMDGRIIFNFENNRFVEFGWQGNLGWSVIPKNEYPGKVNNIIIEKQYVKDKGYFRIHYDGVQRKKT